MKINEPLGIPTEQENADDASCMGAEVLKQLKLEFEDFVAQTRARLQLVSESLLELDREFSHASPVHHYETKACETAESLMDGDAEAETCEMESAESLEYIELDHAADLDEADDDFGFWNESPTEAEPQSFFMEDASPDASFPRKVDPRTIDNRTIDPRTTDANPKVLGANGPVSESKREAFAGSQTPTDTDSDPMERLNAIKQRLARQIENS